VPVTPRATVNAPDGQVATAFRSAKFRCDPSGVFLGAAARCWRRRGVTAPGPGPVPLFAGHPKRSALRSDAPGQARRAKKAWGRRPLTPSFASTAASAYAVRHLLPRRPRQRLHDRLLPMQTVELAATIDRTVRFPYLQAFLAPACKTAMLGHRLEISDWPSRAEWNTPPNLHRVARRQAGPRRSVTGRRPNTPTSPNHAIGPTRCRHYPPLNSNFVPISGSFPRAVLRTRSVRATPSHCFRTLLAVW